jgi:hypothetical protein
MKSEEIPEIDVLISTSLWLWTQRAIPFQYSIAKGQGINTGDDKERLVRALNDAGVPSTFRRFVSSGPDIIAISRERCWQVECKGAGTGQQSTQRNHFDRAVASAVSYYTDSIEPIIPEFAEAKPTLGLAIPATDEFLSLLKRRVPVALRKRLELWVLLYNAQERRIEPIEPSRNL